MSSILPPSIPPHPLISPPSRPPALFAACISLLARAQPPDASDRSCNFIASPEDVIRAHICFRYNTLKSRLALVQSRLQDIESLIKVPAHPIRASHIIACVAVPKMRPPMQPLPPSLWVLSLWIVGFYCWLLC